MSLKGHITDIRGRSVGLPELTMGMQVKNNFDTAFTFLSADAKIYATVGPNSAIDGSAHFLGPAMVEIVQSQVAKGGEASWTIDLFPPDTVTSEAGVIKAGTAWAGCASAAAAAAG